MRLLILAAMLLWILPQVGWSANTQATRFLLVPSKISIGPDDSYQSTSNGDSIYYTKNISLSTQIYKQSLSTGEAVPLLEGDGDSKDPALHPSKDLLAFTYYRNDAKGDICLLKSGKDLECLTSKGAGDKSPFWIDHQTLGYLTQGSGEEWALVAMNLETRKLRTLKKGRISSPAADGRGAYLSYNLSQPGSPQKVDLVLLDLKSGTSRVLQFKLPGLSGISKFSPDGQHLYVSHYLNDTNQDQFIDGSDHSVIFRAKISQLLVSKALHPQQLTSIEDNCNFPDPTSQGLYMTCAFQGALDLYRIPLTGVVPPDWQMGQWQKAHQVARTHAERLLLLNTMVYASQSASAPRLEQILSNHLELGEVTAAVYYVDQLIALKHFPKIYQMFKIYLEARETKNRQPSKLISKKFRVFISKKMQQLKGSSKNSLNSLIKAYLHLAIHENRKALSLLKTVDLSSSKLLPLERYLAFQLYLKILKPKKDMQTLLPLYVSQMRAKNLSEESHLFYGYKLLQSLDLAYSQAKAKYSIISKLQKQIKDIPYLKVLMDAEMSALDLVLAKDAKEKHTVFRTLTKIYADTKNQYFLRKAIYIRGLTIFSRYNEVNYMGQVASQWMRYTDYRDVEIFYASQQYSYITLDKAYSAYGRGDYKSAASVFFLGIRQTNDLEAHAGFIHTTSVKQNKHEQRVKSYEILEKDSLLGKAASYVNTLTQLSLGGSELPSSVFSDCIDGLKPSGTYLMNDGMRYLLRGYCYHQRLRQNLSGYSYDKDDLAQAHRNYLLAEYIGRDNIRIVAAVISNLAYLHQDVHNHSLATRYFSRRAQMGFANPEEELRFRYHYAHSQFNGNQEYDAAQTIKGALALAEGKKELRHWRQPLRERSGFYHLYARQYAEALSFYQAVLKDKGLSLTNQAKIHLALGYCYKKLKRTQQARKHLNQAIASSQSLTIHLPAGQQLVGRFPQRTRIIANGLLASISKPRQAVDYRRKRIEDLQSLSGQEDAYRIKKDLPLEQICLDYSHIASHYRTLKQYNDMATALKLALDCGIKWRDAGGGDLGLVYYRSLINYLALGIKYRKEIKTDTNLVAAIQKTLEAFEQLHRPAPLMVFRKVKLQMFWGAFSRQTTASNLSSMLASKEVLNLKEALPAKYQELLLYGKNLTLKL